MVASEIGDWNSILIRNGEVKMFRNLPLQLQYLLKWRNYDDTENTWEPVENLDCPELIKEFEANRKKKRVEEKSRKSGVEDEREVSSTPTKSYNWKWCEHFSI